MTATTDLLTLDADTYAEAIHGQTGHVFETGTLPAGTAYEVERVYETIDVDGEPNTLAVILVHEDGATYRHRVPLANVLLPVEAGRCRVCGCSVATPSEPVTVSGWYAGHKFRLRDLRAVLTDVRCDAHRTEA